MSLDPIVYFLKERVPFFPWGIIPIAIFFLGSIPGPFEFVLLYNLLWGVFFFKCFYEVLRFDYALLHEENYPQGLDKRSGLILTLVFGFLFMSSLVFIHDIMNVLITFGVILFSLFTHILFKSKEEGKYIQIVPMALLFYLVISY